MAENWLDDVRKYAADADEAVVKKIVRYCGIALQKVDSSLVAFSDAKETDRVRQNYLKKKLGLTHDDATLDAAIAAVGQRMKADRTKNRVTVYYLLAEHFDMLGVFGGAKAAAGAGAGAAAVGAGAAALAAMSVPSAAAAASTADSDADAAPVPAPAARAAGGGGFDSDGMFSTGCWTALLMIGAILLAAVLAGIFTRSSRTVSIPDPVKVAAPAVPAQAAAPVAVPEGAGVLAGERDAKPMLTVYFDTGKAVVTPDFAKVSAPVVEYLKANPAATVAISGFNDPTGNAAANARLSKNRAQNVKAAVEAQGIAPERALLEKPAETTSTGMTNAEARRVEVVVKG